MSLLRQSLVGCLALLGVVLASVSAHAQGSGLTGQYYDTSLFGTLVTTRTDVAVDFNWGTGIPPGTDITDPDYFSVVWTGQVEPEFTEPYLFYLTADDSAQLWVNDQVVALRSFAQGTNEIIGQIKLVAGRKVNLRLEYRELTGNASVKLEWASASRPREVIPTARLHPNRVDNAGGSLLKEHWSSVTGSTIASLTSNTNYPNKPSGREFATTFECLATNWADNYGTRVTGFLVPPLTGDYHFAVSGDEVVELWLSTNELASGRSCIASNTAATAFRQWNAHASQQSSAIPLVRDRRYYVELLHKEASGADHWSVGWRKPGDVAYSVVPGSVLVQAGLERIQPAQAALFDTMAREHPRLYASPEGFARLRARWQSPNASVAQTWADTAIAQADAALPTAPVAEPLTVDTARVVMNNMYKLGLAWQLTGNANYAERAWTELAAVAAFTNWFDGRTLLVTAETTHGFAIAYDWMYPYWTQARRDTIRNAIISQGLNTALTAYQNNFWALRTNCTSGNWAIVCNSGFLSGAVAVGSESEALCEDIVTRAMNSLRGNLRRFTADQGALHEGFNYLEYAQHYAVRGLAGLEWTLGSDFGLSAVPGVSETASVPIYTAGPSGITFSSNDDAQSSPRRGYLWPWAARRFNQPVFNDWANLSAGGSPLNALWQDDQAQSPVAAGWQPDIACHGGVGTGWTPQEYVAMRGQWNDTRATFVAAEAGEIIGSHGHYDAGTFALDALGKRWFHDLGKELYSIPASREDLYRYRAEGHNTLVINPDTGPGMVSVVNCPMLAYQARSGSSGAFTIYDLTPAYSGTTRVWRGFRLVNHRRDLLVQDEITAASGKTVWWFAHFAYPATSVTLDQDGTSVTLTQGAERLWCKIVTGGGAFQVMDAAPLPTSPDPAAQSVNSNFKKLAINLTGVTDHTLAVWFVPLETGENPPADLPAIVALNTWKLSVSNDPPAVVDGLAWSTNGQPVDVDLREFATDDWNNTEQLSFAVTNAQGGTASLLADGHTARFVLGAGAPGFGFRATDTSGLTSEEGTIRIAVSPATTVWTNGSSGNWSAGGNWLNGSTPASSPGSRVEFFPGQSLSSVTINALNDLPGTTVLNSLTLGGTGSGTVNLNLSGGPLQLTKNGYTSPTVNLDAYGGTFTCNVSNALVLADDVTFNGAHSGTFRFLGNITGLGGLTRVGSYSTLVLAGDNSYAGSTVVASGSLQVGLGGATGSLGLGDVETVGAITISRNNAYAISNSIAGSGSLIQNGSGTTTLTGANTFEGTTLIYRGTLIVSSLNSVNGGVPLLPSSSLGAPATAASGTIGAGSSSGSGTLRYVGSGETTDRVINLRGVNGAILDQSGTGLLKFTSDFQATGASSKTLTLTGSTGGTGEIAGTIIDNSSVHRTSVTKSGSGTWTLSGTNAYTGNTTVSAGKLVLSGSVAGSVAVNGGIFRGNGTIASNLTLASSGMLEVNLASPVPGSGFDQLTLGTATSALSLSGALSVVATGELPFNTPFVVINNAGTLPVSGTFAGKPNNATFAASAYNWRISYTGGDGNDVTLTALSPVDAIPGTPTNLTAVALNHHQINLTWMDTATNEAGFTLERSVGSNTNFLPLATVAAGVTGYTDTNAPVNTTCHYRVRAFASVAAWSSYSAEASATTFAAPHLGYSARISFTNCSRSEVLTNFPVLIVLGTNVPGFDYRTFLASEGGDLRLWSGDRSIALNFEVERWDTYGASHVWVQIPRFTNGCEILATWGDPAAVEPVASRTNGATWSEGFLSVWHLGETEGDHLDSSPNQGLSRLVSVTEQGIASGIAGGCDNFNGAGDYVKLSDMGTNAAVTVECWVNLNTVPASADIGLVSSDIWAPGVTHFKTSSTRQVKAGLNGAGSFSSSANVLSVGQWAHAAYTVSGSATNGLQLWCNGAWLGATTGSGASVLSDLTLGREYNARYLNARLDEVRVSSVARSSNWLWATWQNLASNATFNSYGAAAPVASNLPPVLMAVSDPTGSVGILLTVTNSASDPDLPPQRLTFSLPHSPAGAAINPTNGLFSWRPTAATGGSAQLVQVVVSDNGTPGLSATQTFSVLVNPVNMPTLATPHGTNQQFGLVISGDVGPDYLVEASTNLATWTKVLFTNPVTMPFWWNDAAATNFPQRFYRVLLGP